MLGSEQHYQAMVYHCLRLYGKVPLQQLAMNVKIWILHPTTEWFKQLDERKHPDYQGGFEPIPEVVLFSTGINKDWRRRNNGNTAKNILLAVEIKASERKGNRLRAGEISKDMKKLHALREEVRALTGATVVAHRASNPFHGHSKDAPDRTFNLKVSTFEAPKRMVWKDGNGMFSGLKRKPLDALRTKELLDLARLGHTRPTPDRKMLAIVFKQVISLLAKAFASSNDRLLRTEQTELTICLQSIEIGRRMEKVDGILVRKADLDSGTVFREVDGPVVTTSIQKTLHSGDLDFIVAKISGIRRVMDDLLAPQVDCVVIIDAAHPLDDEDIADERLAKLAPTRLIRDELLIGSVPGRVTLDHDLAEAFAPKFIPFDLRFANNLAKFVRRSDNEFLTKLQIGLQLTKEHIRTKSQKIHVRTYKFENRARQRGGADLGLQA